MRLYSFLILFLISAIVTNAQKGNVSGDTIGAIFNEKIIAYNADGEISPIKIPDKGHYFLVYRFKGFDPRRVETIDSVRALEEKITTILLGGMVDNLKVICLSYDKGEEYKKWCENIKKSPPFKESVKYTVEYKNLNGHPDSEARCRDLFTKVTLFGPDGKFLSYSSSIAKFRYHLKNEKILIKGKIVSEKDGVEEPIEEMDVHVEASNKRDTLAKGKTDKYGDFAVKIPNNDTAYIIKANAKDKNVGILKLLTQEGKKISYMFKSNKGFEFKLLKADILELAEMKVDEDITMSIKKFQSSQEKELLVIEDIIYEKDQYRLTSSTEEVLNKVLSNLNKNEKMKLEIISHTDSQGDDQFNLKLSEKRAQVVAEYLIEKGIDKKRITHSGKGETQIRNRCFNNINCSDKEHGYNRRTEFKFSK
ncbi:MAG: OmpA family protein [Sphingobacteriaceae bacterium]|nr:OmpA family protein [Sphingobacteriaceae bacterium]